jgi:hypothetical protein
MQVFVTRKESKFLPDPSRVITRFFYLADARNKDIIRNVLNMTESEISIALSQVLRSYSRRHRNISVIFEKHFNKLAYLFDELGIKPENVSASLKALIGSYFTIEYSSFF